MDFKSNVVKALRLPKEIQIGVVEYKDNKFIVKYKDVEYDCLYDINKFKSLYSLPSNTVHFAWTVKKISKTLTRPEIVKQYWSALKPGMKVKGKIKDNVFVIIN